MKLDLDKLQKKLNQLSKGNGVDTSQTWRPAFGQNRIRLVPYQHNPSFPFIEVYFHFGLEGNPISLKTFGEPDPLDEFVQHIKSNGDSMMLQKVRELQLEPRRRFFVPMIDRQSQYLKFWGFSETVFQRVATLCIDNDLFDPQTGHDLIVTYEKGDRGYPNTTVEVVAAASALGDTKLLQDQPVIFDLWVKPTYEELEQALEERLDIEKAGKD
jgi:hypothetical protein